VLEIPVNQDVFALLRAAGLADLPGRLVDYHWADEDTTVIFTPTLRRLREAGLLQRVLDHVDFFHRRGNMTARNPAGLTHDEDEAEILRLLAEAAPPMRVIAHDVAGQRTELTGIALELVRAALAERDAAGAVEPRTDEVTLRVASPLDPPDPATTVALVDQLNERLAEMFVAAGMDRVTIVYLFAPGSWALADRALFLGRIPDLPEPVRQGLWEDHPLVELDQRLVELIRELPAAVDRSLLVRRLIESAAHQVGAAGMAWELGQVDEALLLLAPAGDELAQARRRLAAPGAWPLRVDDRAAETLQRAEVEAAELLAAMRTPAVLHRVGQRAFGVLDRDRTERSLTSLAKSARAPIELVRAAVAAHPGLSVDAHGLVSIGVRHRRVPLALRAPDDVGLELPGTLAPDGTLTALAGWWLVGVDRTLRDFERSSWLHVLIARAWAASPGPVAVLGRMEIHRVAITVPDGLRLLGPDATDTTELVLAVRRVRGGRRRLVNVFPAPATLDVTSGPARGLADAVPTLRDGGAFLGTGWAIAPDLVLAPLSLFGERFELTVDGVAAEVIGLTPSSFGVAAPLAQRARELIHALIGVDLGTADVAVLHAPGLHATPLAVAAEDVTGGQPLLVAGRDSDGVLRLTLAPVTAAGPATLTLGATLDSAALGGPVLTLDGGVVGMVVDVDPETGLATALAAPVLAAAGHAGRVAARAAGATPDRLLDHVEMRLGLARAAHGAWRPKNARHELRRVELALDHAAAELGARRHTPLSAAEYDAAFARLRRLARQWWLLLRAARGPPTDTAAAELAMSRAAALFDAEHGTGPLTGADAARLADAALALGRPAAWRLYLHYHVDQAGLAAIRRALTPTEAGHQPTHAELELAHQGLAMLIGQLPAEHGDPLAALLARWTDPAAPPAGLPGYLEGELPARVPGLAGPALAAARYLLRRAQPAPGSTDRPGGHSGAVIRGRWRAWLRAWWERVLPLLTRGIQPKYDPTRPRGPPVLEIPLTWRVRALLLVTGLGRLPARLVGYYWADRDAVVVFTPTLTRLREAGLLGRLLAHEDFFHRRGNERERNELGLTHDEDAAQIIDALDEPATAQEENEAPAARQWGRLGLLRTAAIAAPMVALFTASQLGLGWVSGSTAVLVDALDNVFGLLPGLLGLLTLRAARDAVDRFTTRLIGLVMVTTGVDLFTSRILEPDHLTTSPWLLIAAGGLNVLGAGVLAWLYSRVRSATAEAGVAQTLADAISSVSVVGAGIAALLGVAEGLADQVATLMGATLIVFMGVGVITEREVNLLAPIKTLRGIPGSLRAFGGVAVRAVVALGAGVWLVLRAPDTAATSDIEWVAQAARTRVEHRLSRVFRRDDEVALRLDDDRLAGLGDLAGILSDSERFAVHGDRVINVFAVWTHATALADGTLDPAALDRADYAALRRHAAITAVAEGLAVWQAARLVGVPTRVLRGWLHPSAPAMPRPPRSAARRRAWQHAQDGWARIPAGVPGIGAAARPDIWRLLTWEWLRRNHGVRGLLTDDPATPGVSAGELTDLIARGAPGSPAWAQTAATHLHGLEIDVAAELALLARHGLLVGERRGGVERYRPGGELGQLLARAPPAARAALLRNPTHTVGTDLTASTPAEQAHQIHTWLRETVRTWGAGRRAQNRLRRSLGLAVVIGIAAVGWWTLLALLGPAAAHAAPGHQAAPQHGGDPTAVLMAVFVLATALAIGYKAHQAAQAVARWWESVKARGTRRLIQLGWLSGGVAAGAALAGAGHPVLAWAAGVALAAVPWLSARLARLSEQVKAWAIRRLIQLGWLSGGVAVGAVAAATGYGVLALVAGLVLAVGPWVSAVVLIVVRDLLGRRPNALVERLAQAWFESHWLQLVGAGIVIGALWSPGSANAAALTAGGAPGGAPAPTVAPAATPAAAPMVGLAALPGWSLVARWRHTLTGQPHEPAFWIQLPGDPPPGDGPPHFRLAFFWPPLMPSNPDDSDHKRHRPPAAHWAAGAPWPQARGPPAPAHNGREPPRQPNP
jgi:hypothetical protein